MAPPQDGKRLPTDSSNRSVSRIVKKIVFWVVVLSLVLMSACKTVTSSWTPAGVGMQGSMYDDRDIYGGGP